MSGTQSKLVGAALATVGCYAYQRVTGTFLPAEVGGAVAVLMVAAVDILFAGGEPTDPPAPRPVAPPVTRTAAEPRP